MRRTTALLLLAFLAQSCALLRREPGVEVRGVPLTEDTVLLSVPEVRQQELHECGLASLAALCTYYGTELPDSLRAQLALRAEEEDGLSGGELQQALRQVGLEAFLFHGELDHGETGLYRQVDRSRLVLVMLSKDGERNHYCLFTGYDPSTESVYLFDPGRGHVRLRVQEFEPLWENARRFTLLVLPPGQTSTDALPERSIS